MHEIFYAIYGHIFQSLEVNQRFLDETAEQRLGPELVAAFATRPEQFRSALFHAMRSHSLSRRLPSVRSAANMPCRNALPEASEILACLRCAIGYERGDSEAIERVVLTAFATKRPRRAFSLFAPAMAFAALAACGAPQIAGGIDDPFEDRNRKIHAFNKALDRSVLRPLSSGYAAVTPKPVRRGIGNFASNLGLPGAIVNNLLQLRVTDAAGNGARLLVNTTIGLGGVLDPAADMGLAKRETDFGQTLHRWGVAEGNYAELPVLGPATERHVVGRVVDFAMNPVRLASNESQRKAATAVYVADALDRRDRFRSTIDSVLYESADSYAQARSAYLEQRRFKLQGADESEAIDPYEELYDQ